MVSLNTVPESKIKATRLGQSHQAIEGVGNRPDHATVAGNSTNHDHSHPR